MSRGREGFERDYFILGSQNGIKRTETDIEVDYKGADLLTVTFS